MRTSLLGRSATALASVLLVLTLGACGADTTAEESTGASSEGGDAPTEAVSDGGADADDTAGDTDEEGTADESTGGQPGTTAAGECEIKEGSSSLPQGPPEVDEWSMVRGVSVPTSAEYGPYVRDGDLWTCYEHSADGALFAALYVFAASGRVEGFFAEWFPEGETRDHLVENEEDEIDPELGETEFTLIAYRFQTYSEDSAIIDLVAESTQPEGTANVSLRIALMWDGDRWVLDEENFGEAAHAVTSLDGYTPLRG